MSTIKISVRFSKEDLNNLVSARIIIINYTRPEFAVYFFEPVDRKGFFILNKLNFF